MATIKEIAELAGVHRTTASKVLNNAENFRIQSATKKRILRMAGKLGYDRNHYFQAPSKVKSFGLLSMLGYARKENPFLVDVFDGIMDSANKHSINVYVINTTKRLDVKSLLDQESFMGVISLGANYEMLAPFEMTGKPLVGVESPNHLDSSILYHVGTDSIRGTFEATKYLIECGHENIYYLGYLDKNGKESLHSSERYEGVVLALREAGLFNGDHKVSPSPEDGDGAYSIGYKVGYNAMQGLLQIKPSMPLACICFSDVHAEGAYQCVKDNGLRIPEDVSIIGYDNLLSAESMDPPLTTINVPRFELGQKAVQVLCDLDDGEVDHNNLLKNELVIRESVLNRNKE